MSHEAKIKSIKNKTLLWFVSTLIILMITLFFWIEHSHNQAVKIVHDAFEKQVSFSVEHVLEHYNEKYALILERAIKDEEFIRALKDDDTHSIYKMLQSEFTHYKQKDEFIRVIFLHKKDNTSSVLFPDETSTSKKGEYCRPMLKKAHETRTPLYGYDVCKNCYCYRVIIPIIHNGDYLGLLELGYDPMVMLKKLKEITGYESALLLPRNLPEKDANKNTKIIDEDLWIIKSYSEDFTRVLQQLNGNRVSYIDNHHILTYKEKLYNLHPFDLKDFSGKTHAKILLLHDISSSEVKASMLVVSFIVASFFMVLIYIIQRNSLIEELQNLHEEYIRKLEKSESDLRNFYENSPDMYLSVDAKTAKIIFCNKALYEKLGYESKDDIMGKEVFEIYHEESREYAKQKLFPEFLKNGELHESELTFRKKDGSRLYASLDASAINDEEGNRISSRSIMHDMTEIHEANRKLRFNLSYLQAVFDTEPEIMLTTQGEKIDRANRALLEFTGFKSVEEFLEKYNCICDMFEKREGYLQRSIDGISWLEYIYKYPQNSHHAVIVQNGQEYIFHLSANPLKYDKEERSIVILTDVTKEKRAQERLIESEAYIRSIFRAAPVGIGVVKNRVFKSVNSHFCTMIGYSKEELLEKNARMLYESQEEYDYVGKEKYRQIKEHGTGSVESRLKRKDGSVIDVILSSTPIDLNDISKGVTFTALDISARKASEYENIKSKELYQSLVEDISEWIWEVDLEGTFTYASPRVEDIMGYKVDEVVGKALFDFIKKDELQSIKESFKKIVASGLSFSDIHSTQQTKDGKDVVIETNGRAIKDDLGNITGYRGTNRDVTQKSKMQEELKNKEELMIAQSRQAAMGDMISMIAHQWRQPITVVAMAINNLKADIALGEEINTEELNQIGSDILKQTEHLSKTIDDFRDFFKPNKTAVYTSMESVVEKALSMIGKSIQNNNISLETVVKSKTKLFLHENELLQVLLNILNNAKDVLKESKRDDAKISITVTEDAEFVQASICDNGGGIPDEIMLKLGEPYVSSKSKNGTGLGIYMSKTIIEKHLEGTLSWENINGGACFTVALPLNKEES